MIRGVVTASTGAGRGSDSAVVGSRGLSQFGHSSSRGQADQCSLVARKQSRMYHLTRQEARTSNVTLLVHYPFLILLHMFYLIMVHLINSLCHILLSMLG